MTKDKNNPIPAWIIKHLPAYDLAHYLPQRFEDSTHDLWRLENNNLQSDTTNHFLKVVNNTESPFWQIMQDLFGLNLRREIGSFDQLYADVASFSHLDIPTLIDAQTTEVEATTLDAFILTSHLSGSVIDATQVNLDMVEDLAKHLAGLHQQSQKHWGLMTRPQFEDSDWSLCLEQTLIKCAKRWGGVYPTTEKFVDQALAACAFVNSSEFVPLMPDLRWDQFLTLDDNLTALVDLDAFVIAPRELDFVLLEYIIAPEHFEHFINSYSHYHAIPDISRVRPAYRLLLFYMQVLGEQDIEAWMNAEHCLR